MSGNKKGSNEILWAKLIGLFSVNPTRPLPLHQKIFITMFFKSRAEFICLFAHGYGYTVDLQLQALQVHILHAYKMKRTE